jgi:hypothetical protein
MNSIDTLRLVLDHQAAMRHEVQLNSLARSARGRRFGRRFSAPGAVDNTKTNRDTIARPWVE